MFCYYLCVGRMGQRAVNLPIASLLSIVYLTYIYRVSIVYLSCIYRVSIVYLSCLVRDWSQKKAEIIRLFFAEREGFEPPDPLRSTVFKTAAIDHSAIFPKHLFVVHIMDCEPNAGAKVLLFFELCKFFDKKL